MPARDVLDLWQANVLGVRKARGSGPGRRAAGRALHVQRDAFGRAAFGAEKPVEEADRLAVVYSSATAFSRLAHCPA